MLARPLIAKNLCGEWLQPYYLGNIQECCSCLTFLQWCGLGNKLLCSSFIPLGRCSCTLMLGIKPILSSHHHFPTTGHSYAPYNMHQFSLGTAVRQRTDKQKKYLFLSDLLYLVTCRVSIFIALFSQIMKMLHICFNTEASVRINTCFINCLHISK